MNNLKEKLASSLSASDVEIIPYLEYILQDLDSLGSDPKAMVQLIKDNVQLPEKAKILDLGCGKGSVSLEMVKNFDCHVTGYDLMPGFIHDAYLNAFKNDVENRCLFCLDDINEVVHKVKDYDVVILGALGDVLGDQKETLTLLLQTIKHDGFILLDDAFSISEHANYITKQQWINQLEQLQLQLVAYIPFTNKEMIELNTLQQSAINKRCHELINKHPDKTKLFEEYIASQLAECYELENEVVGVTMLISRK